ncbi:anti-sigma factor family protein [Nocardioides sp. LHG3406-4]|uniref:anti-sigma factor family protein n=1 Tax=Nocardioides sp. LHG3406-4 TaxID=2804575 RepID=UPI003CE9514E
MGHLGTRVSALLDGRMPEAEEERWWQHVHQCHPCRDLVEREGMVKTRLAGLSHGDAAAPDRLKHSLLLAQPLAGSRPGDYLAGGSPRRTSGHGFGGSSFVGGVVGGVIGSGAVGVAVVGVLALGAGPANAPQLERRAPVTSLTRPTATATPSDGATTGSDERRTRLVRQAAIREKMGP